jgi:hypothetical protein
MRLFIFFSKVERYIRSKRDIAHENRHVTFITFWQENRDYFWSKLDC